MSLKKQPEKSKQSKIVVMGRLLIFVPAVILLNIFSPVIKQELKYQVNKSRQYDLIQPPVDPNFSIIIPKIGANSKVIENVDPYNSRVYQSALSRGVAHASTSNTPDKSGNTFIFAHSAGNFNQAKQYNAVFYLLNKLGIGDQITVYYQQKPYTYIVESKQIINPHNIDFSVSNTMDKKLTLMTCWPPATDLKRLVVVARYSPI